MTLAAREATVPDELIEPARRDRLIEAEAARFAAVTRETAELAMARPAEGVYDVDAGAWSGRRWVGGSSRPRRGKFCASTEGEKKR